MDLSDQRISYEAKALDPSSLSADPLEAFTQWFGEAQEAAEPEPYAMVLSTVDADGLPQGRAVLLRQFDDSGFVFYTNYRSAKGVAMEATGRAALTFLWHGMHRQVHVGGNVERVSEAESDAYFSKRPRDSQLGAWASEQSTEIASRKVLADRLAEFQERFADTDVPRPEHWGGYRVTPDWIEFWQGQPNRLHDRIRYRRDGSDWQHAILSP